MSKLNKLDYTTYNYLMVKLKNIIYITFFSYKIKINNNEIIIR